MHKLYTMNGISNFREVQKPTRGKLSLSLCVTFKAAVAFYCTTVRHHFSFFVAII